MNFSFSFLHLRKKIFIPVLLLSSLSAGLGGAYLSAHHQTEDDRFQTLADAIFQKELSSSTLTLHYTLADPDAYGIEAPEPTLGTLHTDMADLQASCDTYESQLLNYDTAALSEDHQITRDALLLYYHTQKQLSSFPFLYEPLSPSLGIQAQLPVLLAEYSFYDQKDVLDYLKLLSGISPYFESILDYEKEKADQGLFMSDTTLDRIREQCQSFISDPDSNYMQDIFVENLQHVTELTDTEKEKLSGYHQKLIRTEVIPSYQKLMDGLENLRGRGLPARGLAHYPNGSRYYEYLFQSETGVYEPVPAVEKRLVQQMLSDSKQIDLMLKEQSSLTSKLTDPSIFQNISPEQILTVLKDAMKTYFPSIENVFPEIRTVHPSMQEYLSPAFYLTPPIDTGTPNVIYMNEKNHARGLELFTTLAHEGFPGHLYQTVSFESCACSPIRYLITTPGYIEGWATYIESWAANAAIPLIQDPAASDLAHLYSLNRSINLCLYTLLDIGIHYHGWDLEYVQRFLTAFGIRNPDTASEIFQYIVENPANYPKYYVGALEFNRLKKEQMRKLGDAFSLKDFHEKVLSIGPVPFPVLRKYLNRKAESE